LRIWGCQLSLFNVPLISIGLLEDFYAVSKFSSHFGNGDHAYNLVGIPAGLLKLFFNDAFSFEWNRFNFQCFSGCDGRNKQPISGDGIFNDGRADR
jgi:hypothetical protein